MNKVERDWIDIILSLDKNFYLSNGLQKRTDKKDKKRKRVMDYLNKLQEYGKKCLPKRGTSFERNYKNVFYYSKYIIKEENINDSYFDHQVELKRQKGLGDDPFTAEEKHILALEAIKDQKESLDEWLDYFLYHNGRFYPYYEQFWVFQGLQKLGKYEKEKGKFSLRNKNTVYPFPELDEAALEYTISLMEDFVEEKKYVPGLESAFSSHNFKTIYEYALKEIEKKNSFKSNEGIWKKYEVHSDPKVLQKDIKGKHTGWCTDRTTWTERYLKESDFYVFFTKDFNGEYTNPRITIRANGQDIVEIKGIAEHQNIEKDMEDVLDKKLRDFAFSEEYFDKIKNIKYITLIEKKTMSGQLLSKEELEYIYEINKPVVGFGGQRDPRIREVLKQRNWRKDLAFLFDVSEEEVALSKEELSSDTKVFMGNLDYIIKDNMVEMYVNDEEYMTSVENLNIPDYIVGDLFINGDVEPLPELVSGSFSMNTAPKRDKLVLPKVGVHISVSGLKEADEIILSDNTCYDIRFFDLVICNKLICPESSRGNLQFNKLKVASNFKLPKRVKGNVLFSSLEIASNVEFPEFIGDNFVIPKLEYAHLCTMPKKVIAQMQENNNESMEMIR